ncbi:hypothetical protein PSTT_11646 [Puccinia striiformis]|uniref:Uncharacterized protein n=1 Tax=Puccinia striiformis TaxID=27350 RepID=A0A2S4UZB9_9BASI|nr:hypothetical protein PSTT_11646 [Puccinia striiformis]
MSKEPLNPAQQFILDHLRDPFTHSSLVIASFKIIVGLFVQQRMETGKVLCDSSLPPTFLQQRNLSKQKPFYQLRIMIDILRQSAQVFKFRSMSKRFTDSMTSLIRQQQHFGFRTIILTQEPTVVPDVILDLVSFLASILQPGSNISVNTFQSIRIEGSLRVIGQGLSLDSD